VLHQATISEEVLRPTLVTIDLSAITDNYNALKVQANGSILMCILKANAYGHGLVRVAQHLEAIGAAYFGVAYLEEGIMLREAGIKTPILVMGGIIGDQIPLFIKYHLTITASSVDKLNQIEKVALEMKAIAKVHLKIDTVLREALLVTQPSLKAYLVIWLMLMMEMAPTHKCKLIDLKKYFLSIMIPLFLNTFIFQIALEQ